MSELQAKLARRRSQLTGVNNTPDSNSMPKNGVEEPKPGLPEISVPETISTGNCTTPSDPPEPGSPQRGQHSSPDNWRDTPFVKLSTHMVEEQDQPEKDLDLAYTLKRLEEKVNDKPVKSPAIKEKDSIESLDDFLGGELNEGLEKLELNKYEGKRETSLRSRSSTALQPPSVGSLFDDNIGGYEEGDVLNLHSTIQSLQSELQHKDELIGSLQSEVMRLREGLASTGGDNDTLLESLRESESDPFGAHVGTGRRHAGDTSNRRASYLTRDRINSFSRGGAGKDNGRRRSSSAIEFRRTTFDSPEKIKDMFHLLLEDDTAAVKLAPSNPNLASDEILFGKASMIGGKSSYDPSVVSLGGLALNTRTGEKPITGGSNAAQAAANLHDLLGDESAMFKDVKSPPPGQVAGLFSSLDSVAGEVAALTQQESAAKANEMTYLDFMDRLSEPENRDLAQVIKRFLLSILGPRGDGTAPSIFQDKEIDYQFHGVNNLEKRMSDFYEAMDQHFRGHSAWQGLHDERYVSILDCVERHVLSMISDMAYQTILPDTEQDDQMLAEKMELLQFLPPDALDIPPDLQNEVVWAVAGNELRKINAFRTPGEKMQCIVTCASLITRTLGVVKLRAGQSPDAGADEFLPLFIWVVLRARVPQLYRNTEYISAFHHPTRLMGMGGYCLMNLRSSLEFIKELDSDSITMDKEVFDAQYKAAQEAMQEAKATKTTVEEEK